VAKVGLNALIGAAGPVLAAVVRVSNPRSRPPDPDVLRRGMVAAMRVFEKDALATGLDTRSLRAARYALCATVDDVVLSTPWGSSSNWTQQSLTSIFHNEVIGGDRFFEILEQMQRDLARHAEVVELMYLCTSIGFEGRYRVMQRGAAALTELRDGVYRGIRQRRGEFERELSPHWRGLDTGYRPLSRRIPLWAPPLVAVLLACLIYAGLNLSLAGVSTPAAFAMQALPPTAAARIPRPAGEPPPPPLPPPVAASVAAPPIADKLRQFLAPEIAAGLVRVFSDAQTVTVRLTSTMFPSGSATVAGNFTSLLRRIGDALQDEQGDVLVNGYTDNQPIHTVRFPSNFDLSQARAAAVASEIGSRLSHRERLHVEGKADADPIASNDTPDGRRQNRRTDIVLMRAATP
jgi:type VI secretion system protein ImpK